MIKILFVCHGNICRSPMAEFILKDMTAKQGIASHFLIASAATSTEEIWNGMGNPVYPPARKELARHGIHCDGKRAVQLKREDYQNYDYLIGMDHQNIRNMHRILGGDPGQKIHLLLDYTGHPGEVADPWYTGNFDQTFRDIEAGCKCLMEEIKQKRRDDIV